MTREEFREKIYNQAVDVELQQIDLIFDTISAAGFAIVPREYTDKVLPERWFMRSDFKILYEESIKAGDVVGGET